VTPSDGAIELDGLVTLCKWVSTLLLTGSLLSLIVLVLRVTKQVEFTIGQLKLKLSYLPYVLAGFTCAHIFLTWMFIQRTTAIIAQGPALSQVAWRRVTSSEAFVFYNMRPRIWQPSSGPFGLGTYVASSADTAFWASFVFAIAVVVGVTASLYPEVQLTRADLFRHATRTAALGSALALANWVIGSRWAIQASALFKP
jgi:hypothetical protein